jgi:hypothetical protein
MMFSSQNFVTIQLYPRPQYLVPIPVSVILTPKERFMSTSHNASQKFCSISSHLIQLHSRSTFSRATLISVLSNDQCNLFIRGIFSNSDCATLKEKRLTFAKYLNLYSARRHSRFHFSACISAAPPGAISVELDIGNF